MARQLGYWHLYAFIQNWKQANVCYYRKPNFTRSRMKDRPTQRDIARSCGVSQMTVSLALRGSPKISLPVRTRIIRAARKLHWRPDPMLSVLTNYRNRNAGRRNPATIAWVTNWPSRSGWRDGHPVYDAYFRGAQAQAGSQGYKVEEFWLAAPGMTPERLSKIFYTRNITGLLLPPQPRAHTRIHLAWEKFSAVSFGFTLTNPALHVATNHHFRSAILAMRKLRELGYRRLGILLNQRYDSRVDYSWMAGCLMEQRRYAPAEALPIASLASLSLDALKEYLNRHRPDVLLTNFWNTADWLKQLEIDVPGDLGLAYLSVDETRSAFSGINENSFAIGEAALDLLAIMIQRNEIGIPSIPRHVMIEGYWVPGKTVRRRNRPAKAGHGFL
jgi:DNA-binding LacI/PurR family transcriptional regulator